MRWGSVSESVQQEAKPLFRFFLFDPDEVKNFLLHDRVVDADTAAGRFVAVADQVVRLGPHAARVGVELAQVLDVGVAERVMLGLPAVLFGAPGIKRKLNNPQDVDVHRVVKFEFPPETHSEIGEGCRHHRRLIGHEKQQVAVFSVELFDDRLLLVL